MSNLALAGAPQDEPSPLVHFVVKQLQPQKHGISELNLATAIQEIEIQTQILGASFLKLHIIDPEWTIIDSGLIAVDEDGLLNELVVEFPEKTGYFWQLAAVEGNTDISAVANLIMTFEDRIVARMRQQWGHLPVPSGTTTRAQFVKRLVEEVNLKEHLKPPIKFVCPGVNRIEPIAEAAPAKTKGAKTKAQQEAEKARGVHAGAEFKIKGVAPSAIQRALINEILSTADEHAPSTIVAEALLEAVITENTVSSSGAGLLQFEPGTASGLGLTKGNVKEEVTAFLTKSYTGETLTVGKGGAIEWAAKHPNAAAYEIAQAAQGSGAGKESKGSANYGPHQLEAQEILHAYGGVRPGGTTPSPTTEKADIGQLTRGTPTNPDEDSWDCATRLAQDVDWNFFTDGRDTVFFMDGPDLMAQRPVLYIDVKNNHVIKEDKGGQKVEEYGALIRPLSFTYDNTAFEYRATHKVKQRVQRKSRISKPQTPSEVRMLMLCGLTEYHAGDVVVFKNCGPISENGGRWIISDATRECTKYPYTKFILTPPVEPLPEPKATATSGEGAQSGSATAAFNASSTLSSYELPYLWGGGHAANGLLNIAKGGSGLDCSGSSCWVLKQAGMFTANQAEVSGELEKFGEAGPGKEMTVWANAVHVFIEFNVAGHERAQMNTNGPQNGPRLYTISKTATYNPNPSTEGFTARHWPGT